MHGPYKSVEEACEAYVATLNREVPQERFLHSLHPEVVFSTKYENIRGRIPVVFHLETRWNWCINDPSPITSVTMPVRLRMADGELRHYCALFNVDRVDKIILETYLTLNEGWVSAISIRSAWEVRNYPFLGRVIDLVNRLRAARTPTASESVKK